MNASKARAFWVTEPGHGEIREETLPAPAANQARIRTLYSGVSRGTETLVFAGRVPRSEYARMRAPFQAGDFPGPVKYGYINVGIVETGPEAWLGRTVFCLFPHQTHFNAPLGALSLLPAAVPAARAVLAANMETALNALWDAGLQRGGRISVIGAGALGCLCGWLAASRYEADVELIDIDPARAAIAEKLGLRFAAPRQAAADVPLLVHTSASQEGLETALALAGFEAVIVELSWYGDAPVSLPLGAAFHSQRLSIRSSQVGHVATPMRGHATRASRLRSALRLLAEPALDCLIDSHSHFEELPAVIAALASGERKAICHRVEYFTPGD